jgi:hypothetical protein
VRFPAFYEVDGERGYGLRPGAQGDWTREGKGSVRINDAGFRGPDVARRPADDVLRIAVLGDSFTEALQVDDADTWVRRLEAALAARSGCALRRGHPGGVEVLNFGVGGYGTGQELLTWRHLARLYRPQVVLLSMYLGNDLADNDPEPRPDRPVFRLGAGGRLEMDMGFRDTSAYRFRSSPLGRAVDGLMNHSRLLQLANEAKNRLAADRRSADGGSGDPRAIPRTPPGTPAAWAVTDALLGQLQQETRADDAGLRVLSMSTPEQLWPRRSERPADPDAQERRLAELLRRRGIPYLALAPLLREQADRSQLVLHGFPGQAPGQGHWNALGHRQAAAAVADWLCRP